jgi:hypothetical protein
LEFVVSDDQKNPEPKNEELMEILELTMANIISILEDMGSDYEDLYGNDELVPTMILKALGQLAGRTIAEFSDEDRDGAMDYLNEQVLIVIDKIDEAGTEDDPNDLANMATQGNA